MKKEKDITSSDSLVATVVGWVRSRSWLLAFRWPPPEPHIPDWKFPCLLAWTDWGRAWTPDRLYAISIGQSNHPKILSFMHLTRSNLEYSRIVLHYMGVCQLPTACINSSIAGKKFWLDWFLILIPEFHTLSSMEAFGKINMNFQYIFKFCVWSAVQQMFASTFGVDFLQK